MARKVSASPRKNTKTPAKVKNMRAPKPKKAVENSFQNIGFGFGGFPQNQGTGFSEQLSNVTTGFKNLRWYLISNFYQFLCELYAEIGLVQVICDVPVDDALRGGVEISSKDLDEDQISELQAVMEDEQDIIILGLGAKWTRLFGGGGVIIITGADPSTPFNPKEVANGGLLAYKAVDMWELFGTQQNMEEGYTPENFRDDTIMFNYYGIRIHRSRVLIMKGTTAPSFLRSRLRGWGLSVCEPLTRPLNQYLKSGDLLFEVTDEFKLDIYKMKNLTNTLMQECGKQKVHDRIQTANYLKNYQNALVMDSEDDYEQKQISFAGLAEAFEQNRITIASELRMPLTKIFGMSAAGFNSGEDDIEVYNGMIESSIRSKVKTPLKQMIEIRCMQTFGFIPKDLTITFKPLRVLSSEQEEKVKDSKMNRLRMAKEDGIISPKQYIEACNRGNLFDVKLDDNVPENLEANPEDEVVDTEATENETENPKQLNSAQFDKASYEADGGDSWIDSRRQLFFDKTPKDPGLWTQAKVRSKEAFGAEKWQFTVWMYKKLGGKF